MVKGIAPRQKAVDISEKINMGWRRIWIPQLLVIPILLWGLVLENPNQYYTYAKWFCCLVFLSISGVCSVGNRNLWAFLWFIITIAYCPLLNIGFLEKNWYYVNVSTLAITVLSLLVGMGYMVNREQEILSQMPSIEDTRGYSTNHHSPANNNYSKEIEALMNADLIAMKTSDLERLYQRVWHTTPPSQKRELLLSKVDEILKKRGV